MPIQVQQNIINVKNANEDTYHSASGYIVGSVTDIEQAKTTAINTVNQTKTTAISEVEEIKTQAINNINSRANEIITEDATAEEIKAMFAGTFSSSISYATGKYVIQQVEGVNHLFRFTQDHAAGAWTENDVVEVKLANEMTELANETNELKSAIDFTVSDLNKSGVITKVQWTQGSIDNLGREASAVSRARTDFISGKTIVINNNTNTYELRLFYYNSSKVFLRYNDSAFTNNAEYIIPDDVSFVRLLARHNPEQTITDSNRAELYNYVYFLTDVVTGPVNFRQYLSNHLINIPKMRNGAVSNPGNAESVCMEHVYPTNGATGVKVFCNAAKDDTDYFEYRYTTFNKYDVATQSTVAADRIRVDQILRADNNNCAYIPLYPDEAGIAIAILRYDENDTRIPLRVETFGEYNFGYCYIYMPENVYSGKIVGANMLPTPVYTKEFNGYIKYMQAFCVNGDYIYSTNGSAIAEQAINFDSGVISTTPTRDVTVSAGHGNSFQIGHGNSAYISGWDDNTVYICDLTSLTITGSIILPTTGYTTCAIDDINKIAYIFQRDSSPNTPTNYNFIAYDYENEQILLQKKTTNIFGAMQACDFVDGKIIVAYGLGTSANPSGIVVYNTNCDIIATFDLPGLFANELEGIWYDKNNISYFISLVNQHVHKIYV